MGQLSRQYSIRKAETVQTVGIVAGGEGQMHGAMVFLLVPADKDKLVPPI